MSNIFHCFAGAYFPWIYNNVIHRITGEIPSLKLWGKFVSVKYLHPFGARVKVLTNLPSERALTARTSGDAREEEYNYDANAITIIDASQKSAFTGQFLGYSQHPNVMLILKEGNDTEPSRIIRAHHAYVDPFGFSSSTSPNDAPTPNERLLLAAHNQLFDTTAPTTWQTQVQDCDLDFVASPFDPKLCETFKIVLPPKGQSIGAYIDTDEDYIIPILGKISKDYNLYDQIPLRHQYYKSWIVQIGMESPCTSQGFIEAVHSLQLDDKSKKLKLPCARCLNRFDTIIKPIKPTLTHAPASNTPHDHTPA
jgi:hypothetical protein